MQAIVILPNVDDGDDIAALQDRLFGEVAGIPLLCRVLMTASKSGVTSFMIVHSRALSETWLRGLLEGRCSFSEQVRMAPVPTAFDPARPADWRRIESHLDQKFLWLPWNFVTSRKTFASLMAARAGSDAGIGFSDQETDSSQADEPPPSPSSIGWNQPIVLIKERLLTAESEDQAGAVLRTLADGAAPPLGIAVTSARQRRQAEDLLVRGSGKVTDGFHSNFNRRLCWPAVRWLSRTPITANMITFAGLPAAGLAGYAYAQGNWPGYVIGSLLYFLSVLFDEMDGMIARIKFQDSPFGCKLEAFVDLVSYLPLWTGMTLGLYRQYGDVWLVLGGLIFFGTFMSFILQAYQRKMATHPDRPQDHIKIVYEKFEADSGNWISWISRKAHFLTKKGAMCHYVVWFSVLGLLPVFFVLTMLGANLLWIFGIHANRFFRSPDRTTPEWKKSADSVSTH